MVLIVQNDQGSQANANSYLTMEEFRAYWSDRGVTFAQTDDELSPFLVLGTDYVDKRFHYLGKKLRGREQTTEWPRLSVTDAGGYSVEGIPREVKNATAEYASRAASGSLMPDPTRDASGSVVQAYTESVSGAVSKSVTFAQGAGYSLPKYPLADRILTTAGFILSGYNLVRG